MTSELFLPAPAMESVLSFLDARDLATMAQTCLTWKRIVYRKSVWNEKNIVYRHCPTVILSTVPPRARHIGAPTQFCFLHWLHQKLMANGRCDTLPVYIQHITDATTFMKVVYGHWQRHGSPCMVREHHKLQDLLCVPIPTSVSKSDKQRILYRLVEGRTSAAYNVYCQYLDMQNVKLGHTLATPPVAPDTTDPLHQFMKEIVSVTSARNAAVNDAILAQAARYQACITALARHGHSEFEINDTWFTRSRELLWSTAGFSYKKPTA